jgi:hypothetical protein
MRIPGKEGTHYGNPRAKNHTNPYSKISYDENKVGKVLVRETDASMEEGPWRSPISLAVVVCTEPYFQRNQNISARLPSSRNVPERRWTVLKKKDPLCWSIHRLLLSFDRPIV